MTITIPKEAVTTSDEDGEDIVASVGDQVDLSGVVAMVTADAGDSLTVDITAVNGFPLAAPEAEVPVEGADIRAAMEQVEATD